MAVRELKTVISNKTASETQILACIYHCIQRDLLRDDAEQVIGLKRMISKTISI